MSGEELFVRVECYVGLRRALGYVVRSEEKLLKDFVRFVEAQAIAGPIRVVTVKLLGFSHLRILWFQIRPLDPDTT